MLSLKKFPVILLFLLINSCGPKVQQVRPVDESQSRYNSFAYLPNSTTEVPGQNYNDVEINTAIIETINLNMKKAGYKLDTENPALLVLVSTKVMDSTVETATETVYLSYPYSEAATTVRPYYLAYYYPGYKSFNNIIGYDTETFDYEEGTLIISLIDRDTQIMLWKGFATDAVYSQGTQAATRDLINVLFVEYPMNQ